MSNSSHDVFQRLSPSARQDVSHVGALIALWREIVAHRWHISVSFQRELAGQARLTQLGQLWNYILPLVPISVYALLMSLRLFPSFGGVSGIVYIAIGVTVWFYLAGLVRRPMETTEARIRESGRTGFPLSAATVAGSAQLVFDTGVRLAAVIILFALFQGVPAWQLVYVPVVALAATLFFLGAGLFLAMLNLVYRDVGRVVAIGLQYGIFLSGVLFPLDRIPALASAMQFNPFYVFIENMRRLATSGSIIHPEALAIFSVLGIVLFLGGARLFYVLEARFRGLV
ncbi:MAG: ABC transporter permease [Pseudomonadota bacterium]